MTRATLRPNRRFRARALAVAAAAVLLASGCSNPSDPDQADPAPSSSTTAQASSPTTDRIDARPVPEAPDPDPTPLAIDPATRIGTLDNGLTYYVRENDSPGSNLELRLVVNAGSLQEADAGQGAAHFLEHMLFNGTEKYPGNELDGFLRGFGAEIGPDFNAYTSQDETVYQLSLSTFTPGVVDTGFDILHQWAAAATIDPEAVEAERGIVRQEYRESIETGSGVVVNHFDDLYLDQTVYAGRDPVGSIDGIETVTAEELRAFYDLWYRPDNMAIIAVGDVSADRLEQEITDRFGSLVARGADPTPLAGDVHHRTEPDFSLVTHPDESIPFISIDWPIPTWEAGTVGGERLITMEGLLATMITDRLDRARAAGDLSQSSEPFVTVFPYTRVHTFLGTAIQADDLVGATGDFFGVVAGLESEGFTDDELDQAVSELQAAIDLGREIESTTQDASHAASFIEHFLSSAEIDESDATFDRLEALVRSITRAELENHLRWLLAQDSPLVVGVGPSLDSLPTLDELREAVADVQVTVGVAGVEQIDSLMDSPDPVDPVGSDRDAEVGSWTWTFENGARVSFVETEIVDGFVDVLAVGGGGSSQLTEGEASVAWLAAIAVDESGVGDHGGLALDQYLRSSSVALGSYIDQSDEGFIGSSSAEELEILFQLLHLRMTEPRVEPSGLDQARLAGENAIASADHDPWVQSMEALLEARYGQSPGYSVRPDATALAGLDEEQALAIFESRLGQVDDFVVAVAGDVDRAEVEELASRYIGTLPAGPSDSWIDVRAVFPAGLTTRDVDLSADVTAAGVLVYAEAALEVDAGDEVTALVLTSIINSRLFEGIREELGASYGGSGSVSFSRRPAGSLELLISADSDPDRLDEVQAAILDELQQLASAGPARDEMNEALAVVGDDFGFESNWDHLVAMVDLALMPDQEILTIAARYPELDRVSAFDVRDMAQALVGGGDLIVVTRSVG